MFYGEAKFSLNYHQIPSLPVPLHGEPFLTYPTRISVNPAGVGNVVLHEGVQDYSSAWRQDERNISLSK